VGKIPPPYMASPSLRISNISNISSISRDCKNTNFFKNGKTGNTENFNKNTGKYRYLPDKIKPIKRQIIQPILMCNNGNSR
jgi:hypothetical protein